MIIQSWIASVLFWWCSRAFTSTVSRFISKSPCVDVDAVECFCYYSERRERPRWWMFHETMEATEWVVFFSLSAVRCASARVCAFTARTALPPLALYNSQVYHSVLPEKDRELYNLLNPFHHPVQFMSTTMALLSASLLLLLSRFSQRKLHFYIFLLIIWNLGGNKKKSNCLISKRQMSS